MNDYIINTAEIEELQTVKNINALNVIFEKAKRTIVHGSKVILTRKTANGVKNKFDELTTEEGPDKYRQTVFKYL